MKRVKLAVEANLRVNPAGSCILALTGYAANRPTVKKFVCLQ